MNNKTTLHPMKTSKAKQAFYNDDASQTKASRKANKKANKLAIKQARLNKNSFEY